jgi:iron-sulfur cluster repair protein YtfE (RIC family)
MKESTMHIIQIETNHTHLAADPRTLAATTPIMVLIAEHSELQPVLDRFGLDTCCGGHMTVVEAARELGLDPETVVQAVVEALEARSAG